MQEAQQKHAREWLSKIYFSQSHKSTWAFHREALDQFIDVQEVLLFAFPRLQFADRRRTENYLSISYTSKEKMMDSHYLTPTEDSLYSEKTIERKYFCSVSVRNSSYSTRRQRGDTVLLTELLYTFHSNFYLKHFSTKEYFLALWYLIE